MTIHARRPVGFTLIELMVVIAIIGILSSVAIPSYRNFQLRSKQAERAILMTAIQRSIEDMYMSRGAYPWDLGGGLSYLYLAYANPNSTPRPYKQPWRYKPLNWLDHWNQLSLVVEGSVYYSYWGYAYINGRTRWTILQASSDLDGDGIPNQVLEYWYLLDNKLQTWSGGTYPCAYCSIGYEDNPQTF